VTRVLGLPLLPDRAQSGESRDPDSSIWWTRYCRGHVIWGNIADSHADLPQPTACERLLSVNLDWGVMLLAVGAYFVHEHTNVSEQFNPCLQRNLRGNGEDKSVV
jgi:hypothetical protein